MRTHGDTGDSKLKKKKLYLKAEPSTFKFQFGTSRLTLSIAEHRVFTLLRGVVGVVSHSTQPMVA